MGKKEKTYLVRPNFFPNSEQFPIEICSPETKSYNCIGWAMGAEYLDWFEPTEKSTWFNNIAPEQTIEAVQKLFEKVGFEVCNSKEIEQGYIKIALFSDDFIHVLHAARQLPNGFWTSKLGISYDVNHELQALENGIYGNVVALMKKKN